MAVNMVLTVTFSAHITVCSCLPFTFSHSQFLSQFWRLSLFMFMKAELNFIRRVFQQVLKVFAERMKEKKKKSFSYFAPLIKTWDILVILCPDTENVKACNESTIIERSKWLVWAGFNLVLLSLMFVFPVHFIFILLHQPAPWSKGDFQSWGTC